MVSKTHILDAISDKKASNIFKRISSGKPNSDVLITQLRLTRKQYYSSLSRLTQTGLVKRQNGKYYLTAFGKVIHYAYVNFETKIEDALTDYWKLKAIDSLEVSSGSTEERYNIISALLDNQEIKSVLIREEPNSPTKETEDILITVPN
jgi:predicted transcriptional regulator